MISPCKFGLTLRVFKVTWATHSLAELDLFCLHRGRRLGIDFKFSEAPKRAKSLYNTLEALQLDHLWLIYPGAND